MEIIGEEMPKIAIGKPSFRWEQEAAAKAFPSRCSANPQRF